MPQTLVDRIYEAAFIPEYWEDVIADIARLSRSISGSMLLVDPNLPPLWAATSNIHEQLGAYAQTSGWYNNPRMLRLLRRDHAGFVRDIDVSTEEEIRADLHVEYMARAGLENQAATGVQLSTGELVMFTIERAKGEEHYDDNIIVALDALRPHLARSSLMAARLKLTQARSTVDALQSVELPAAVVAADQTVLATNDLFDTTATFLRPAAFGKLYAPDQRVNSLLQDALTQLSHMTVRSIPIRATRPGDAPAVLHAVPLRRNASDIFRAGATLLVVTAYTASGRVPADSMLKELFDLSAAEAKLAAAVSSGQTLKAVASDRRISITTARTQLAQVFHKTGTHQQSELVALLKSAHSIAAEP